MKGSRRHRLPPCRLFVLGAGFSAHAGIPLAKPLYDRIRRYMVRHKEDAYHYRRDRRRYLQYQQTVLGDRVSAGDIDFESMLTFLDIEHYLGLKGKDTWSNEGNQSQLIIRRAIAQILFESQFDAPTDSLRIYDKFARSLLPRDLIITFNYDTLLEQSLEKAGVKFRLVPYRYAQVYADGESGTLVLDDDEVIVLKMHGSIDWFDLGPYFEQKKRYTENPGQHARPWHNSWIVQEAAQLDLVPVAPSPYVDSPLKTIFRCRNLSYLYQYGAHRYCRPVMIMPSHAKMAYSEIYKDFWFSFTSLGSQSSQVIVIGYSFPPQDSYALQPVLTAIRNHIEYFALKEYFDRVPVKMVTLEDCMTKQHAFRERFPFLTEENAKFFFDGFGEQYSARMAEIVEPSRYREGAFEEMWRPPSNGHDGSEVESDR